MSHLQIIGCLAVYAAAVTVVLLLVLMLLKQYKEGYNGQIMQEKMLVKQILELQKTVKLQSEDKSKLIMDKGETEILLKKEVWKSAKLFNELEWYRTKLRAVYPNVYRELGVVARVEMPLITNDELRSVITGIAKGALRIEKEEKGKKEEWIPDQVGNDTAWVGNDINNAILTPAVQGVENVQNRET